MHLGTEFYKKCTPTAMVQDCVQRDAIYPTGQVNVSFTEAGHQFEIMSHQAYDFMEAEPILTMLQGNQPEMLYIGTFALRNAQTLEVARQLLHHVTCPIFCDINLRTPWYSSQTVEFALRHANIVKVNHEELAEIANILGIVGNTEQQAQILKMEYAIEDLLITFGEEGSWWINPLNVINKTQKASLKNPFIDSVGAGDAYSAVVILGLLQGWNQCDILNRASHFAAAICCERGAIPVSKEVYQLD